MVRLGVALYLLGRYFRACEILNRPTAARWHISIWPIVFARGNYAEAVESYQAAERPDTKRAIALGPGRGLPLFGRCEGRCTCWITSSAPWNILPTISTSAAPLASVGGNPLEVVALYERAVEADRGHPGALFGLALENDRYGNDEMALEMYRRAAAAFPAHVGSLVNLGLLYEDREQYERAAQCYQRVLDSYPDHNRAPLFIKDTEATHEQFFDDDALKKPRPVGQVLNIPVTDFELSVRSRNCLEKMNLATLGDLAGRARPSCWRARISARRAWWRSRRCCRPRGCGWDNSPPSARPWRPPSRSRFRPTSRPVVQAGFRPEPLGAPASA